MAILDTLPGLEVSVCIDGKPLDEYEDDENQESPPGRVGAWQSTRTISKYIPSESDKQFSIHIKVARTYIMDSPGLDFPIRIDDKWMTTPCLTNTRHPRIHQTLTREFSEDVRGATVPTGYSGNESILKRFKFTKIETTTDDGKLVDVQRDSKRLADVGVIQVKVYRQSECIPWNPVGIDTPDIHGSSKIHEKALKGQAKSHSTALGPTEASTTNWVKADRIDGDQFPIAIFRFKYRSKEALKQLYIIPRTPSPEPVSSSAGNVDGLNAEQREKLKNFMAGLVGSNASGSSQRPIKREHGNGGSSSRKRQRPGEKITIDLTEDSDDDNIVALN